MSGTDLRAMPLPGDSEKQEAVEVEGVPGDLRYLPTVRYAMSAYGSTQRLCEPGTDIVCFAGPGTMMVLDVEIDHAAATGSKDASRLETRDVKDIAQPPVSGTLDLCR
eukprot:3606252-Rhodomonas_salina.1